MALKSVISLLVPTALLITLAACTVKERTVGEFVPDSELVEQNTAMEALAADDSLLVLLDEASRVNRTIRLATETVPAGDSKDGCITYQVRPASKQTILVFDCMGTEERRDAQNFGRTLVGREVVRTSTNGAELVGAVDIRRYRPRSPGKTVRAATLSHRVRVTGQMASAVDESRSVLKLESITEFNGHQAKQVPRSESWISNIEADWNRVIGKAGSIAAGATMTLFYSGETGTTSTLSLRPLTDVKFEDAINNACPRPMGKFAMRLTTNSVAADGSVKATLIEETVVTTPEGIRIGNSTSVVAWPLGCLENAPR